MLSLLMTLLMNLLLLSKLLHQLNLLIKLCYRAKTLFSILENRNQREKTKTFLFPNYQKCGTPLTSSRSVQIRYNWSRSLSSLNSLLLNSAMTISSRWGSKSKCSKLWNSNSNGDLVSPITQRVFWKWRDLLLEREWMRLREQLSLAKMMHILVFTRTNLAIETEQVNTKKRREECFLNLQEHLLPLELEVINPSTKT